LRVAVVGLGLIGGSIALAARERLGAEVSGWDLDAGAIDAALSRGAIDLSADSPVAAVAAAEVVFVAAPVGVLVELIGAVLDAAPAGAVITDVGSTKRTVVQSIEDPRFIGGHPLAGGETSGIEHARADLFDTSIWYLTPGSFTATTSTARIGELVSAFGATANELDADMHDRLMAAVSHLPHVFANVLVSHLVSAEAPVALGPSFRDATRVAGSNPAVWSAIYMDNRDELIAALDDAIKLLADVRDSLASADRDAVVRWCEQAAGDVRRLAR
jgi:prephenate dehydrogenase